MGPHECIAGGLGADVVFGAFTVRPQLVAIPDLKTLHGAFKVATYDYYCVTPAWGLDARRVIETS